MFLSITLLKRSGAVNGHFWTLSCLFCNKVAIFVQWNAHMKARMAQKCVYGDEMFLSSISLKYSSPINCVLHINLYTSDVRMQHLCITASKYCGLSRTFYDIRNTQYFVDCSRHTSAKIINNRQVVV